MTTKIENWTPKKAQQALDASAESGGYQRKISPHTVNKYVKAMNDGTFRTTAEPVIIDTENTIQNGQHRLKAVAISGVPMKFNTTRGADPDDFLVIDRGLPRRAGQFIARDGDPKIAVVRNARALVGDSTVGNGRRYDTTSDQALLLRDYEERWGDVIEKFWPEIKKARYFGRVPTGPVGAVVSVALLYGKNGEKVPEFLEAFQTLMWDGPKDPRLKLFRAWTAGGVHLTKDWNKALAYVAKTWNSFVKGEELGHLRFNEKTDQMPEIL
jgi:hypothetical protein